MTIKPPKFPKIEVFCVSKCLEKKLLYKYHVVVAIVAITFHLPLKKKLSKKLSKNCLRSKKKKTKALSCLRAENYL